MIHIELFALILFVSFGFQNPLSPFDLFYAQVLGQFGPKLILKRPICPSLKANICSHTGDLKAF